MCLNNITKVEIAKDDIIVYKHIMFDDKHSTNTIKYMSSFKQTPIEFNKMLYSPITITDIHEDIMIVIGTNEQIKNIEEEVERVGNQYRFTRNGHINIELSDKTKDNIINIYNKHINNYPYRDKISIFHGFHSYIDIEDADYEAKFYSEILVPCIIPKSSLVFYGIFNNYKSIVSNQIKYLNVVKHYLRHDMKERYNKLLKQQTNGSNI